MAAPDTSHCPRCGGPLDAATGACRKCGPAPRTVRLTGASPSSTGPAPPRPTGTTAPPTAGKRMFAERYEILAKVGQGSFGTVYRARDQVLSREVALKVLRLEGLGNSEQVQEIRDRFLREAQIVAKLNHPNIIPVYDLGESQGYTYIAMQLITGEPLDVHLKRVGKLEAESVVRMGVALADALHYAHVRGVIHRDIKPANVILDELDNPRIADFGIAKVEQDAGKTREGTIVGTVAYMSPEQLRGDPLDGRSDLFALGCVLYELLLGHRAFDGPNMTAIMTRIINDPVDLKTELGAQAGELLPIIAKLLEKDRDRRYATGAEARADLERLLPERQAGTAEMKRLAAEVERLRKEKQRAMAALGGVGVAALVVAAVTGLRGTELAAYFPVFALVSPALIIGLFYRDVLRRVNPIYWALAALFGVMVLVDSYYLAKLALPAAEIATRSKQTIPTVSYLHYAFASAVVHWIFPILLVVNVALVALRERRQRLVDCMNRPVVTAVATVSLAGFLVFMFAAMAGQWQSMTQGLNMTFVGAKLRVMEEEGHYEELIEGFLDAMKGRDADLEKPPWQRRLARLYRVTAQTERMRGSWRQLSQALLGRWDDNDAACYLAVGNDFAKYPLYHEDAVAAYRAGLAVAPGDDALEVALMAVLEKMGFAAEAAAVVPPPPEPMPDATAAESPAP